MSIYGQKIGQIEIYINTDGIVTAVDPLGLIGRGKKVRGALRDLAENIERMKKNGKTSKFNQIG
jgi:hypothetical protein